MPTGVDDQKMIGLRFSNVIDPSAYANFPSFENDPASRVGGTFSSSGTYSSALLNG